MKYDEKNYQNIKDKETKQENSETTQVADSADITEKMSSLKFFPEYTKAENELKKSVAENQTFKSSNPLSMSRIFYDIASDEDSDEESEETTCIHSDTDSDISDFSEDENPDTGLSYLNDFQEFKEFAKSEIAKSGSGSTIFEKNQD